MGLEQVCLPALLEGASPVARAAALKLQPLPDRLVPNRVAPGDRGWYLPTTETTLVIAWADGSCSVQMLRGDGRAAFAQMQPLLRPRAEHFAPGAIEQPAPDLKRMTYCEAKRPNPVVVTFTMPLPDAKARMAASSTVFRSHTPGEPPFCVRTILP